LIFFLNKNKGMQYAVLLDYNTGGNISFQTHCRANPKFDFHRYMLRALEADFKKVVGIRYSCQRIHAASVHVLAVVESTVDEPNYLAFSFLT
jgi:hypothetical protein